MKTMEENWLDKIVRRVKTRPTSANLSAWAKKLADAADKAYPSGPPQVQGIIDTLYFWGYLTLKVFHGGKLLQVIEGPNVIINAGKVFNLQLLGNVSGAQSIVKMAVGDGGCGINPYPTPSQLDTPIPFVVTDTDLRHQITFSTGSTQPINPGPVVNESGRYITFVAVFNSSLVTPSSFGYTPNVVNEIALVSGNNKILALRAFKSVPFDQASAIELRAEWAIGCP